MGHAPGGPTHVVGVHHPAPGNENAPGGAREPSFAFRHRRSFLSVRASQDPLHGQEGNLAAVPAGRSCVPSDGPDDPTVGARRAARQPGTRTAPGPRSLSTAVRHQTWASPSSARAQSTTARDRRARRGRGRRCSGAIQTPSSARAGSDGEVAQTRPRPPTSPSTSTTKSIDRPNAHRSSHRRIHDAASADVGRRVPEPDRSGRPMPPRARSASASRQWRSPSGGVGSTGDGQSAEHARRVVRRRRISTACQPASTAPATFSARSSTNSVRSGASADHGRPPVGRRRRRAWPRRAGTSWRPRRTASARPIVVHVGLEPGGGVGEHAPSWCRRPAAPRTMATHVVVELPVRAPATTAAMASASTATSPARVGDGGADLGRPLLGGDATPIIVSPNSGLGEGDGRDRPRLRGRARLGRRRGPRAASGG